MPGICGLVTSDPGLDVGALGAAMAGRMLHHPWYARHTHADPASGLFLARVSLGFVNAAPQPAFNEDRSLVAVMDGEVFDYAELRRELEQAGHRFAGDSQAELLIH